MQNETPWIKWAWKMDYCKNNGLSPADPKNWEEAEKAYQTFMKGKKK